MFPRVPMSSPLSLRALNVTHTHTHTHTRTHAHTHSELEVDFRDLLLIPYPRVVLPDPSFLQVPLGRQCPLTPTHQVHQLDPEEEEDIIVCDLFHELDKRTGVPGIPGGPLRPCVPLSPWTKQTHSDIYRHTHVGLCYRISPATAYSRQSLWSYDTLYTVKSRDKENSIHTHRDAYLLVGLFDPLEMELQAVPSFPAVRPDWQETETKQALLPLVQRILLALVLPLCLCAPVIK